MPIRSRCAAAGTLLWLGLAAAHAQQPAGSWTDPPARGSAVPDASGPPGKAAAPSSAKASSDARPEAAPAMQSAQAGTGARDGGGKRGKVRAAASARQRPVAGRSETPRRAVRRETPDAGRRMVRASPRARIAATRPQRSFAPAERGLPVGVAPPSGPEAWDPRLERLRSAQEAGYIVVRGRTVEFPDGRTLRVYRPVDEGDDLD